MILQRARNKISFSRLSETFVLQGLSLRYNTVPSIPSVRPNFYKQITRYFLITIFSFGPSLVLLVNLLVAVVIKEFQEYNSEYNSEWV